MFFYKFDNRKKTTEILQVDFIFFNLCMMISKWQHIKEEAINLRKKGNSLPQISILLGIPKSTLSGWLKGIVLSDEQKMVLRNNWLNGLIEARKRAVIYHSNLKNERLLLAQQQAGDAVSRIDIKNSDTAELALALLYLGEGFKTNVLGMGNSDPLLLKFFLSVLYKKYSISKDKIYCELHLRADQDPDEIMGYWSKELNLPLTSFRTVVFDKRTIGKPTYPTYKGVCVIKCGNVAIRRKLIYLGRTYCTSFIESSAKTV